MEDLFVESIGCVRTMSIGRTSPKNENKNIHMVFFDYSNMVEWAPNNILFFFKQMRLMRVAGA